MNLLLFLKSILKKQPVELLSCKTAPHKHLKISVIVPCKNEAAHLQDALFALKNQFANDNKPFCNDWYEVILLINNSNDTSYKIATRFKKQYPEFVLHVNLIKLSKKIAHIGTVRRLLMDTAFHRLNLVTSKGIIVSTDSDTIVDRHWLYNIIKEIEAGNDAVGGRILSVADKSASRIFHLRDVKFRMLVAEAEALLDPHAHDPWPRHHQFFGANAAVTCNMYKKAGRLPRVPFLEDAAFYNALISKDAKVRKSNNVKVYTSSRLQGKVKIGFSEQLTVWHNMHQKQEKQLAEPAEAIILKFKNKSTLRDCWNEYKANRNSYFKQLYKVADGLSIDAKWLYKEFKMHEFFGGLWQQVEKQMQDGSWCRRWHPVEINETIQKLQQFVKDKRSLKTH